MVTLIFDPPTGPSGQELLEDGETIPAGGEFTVTNDRAAELLAQGIHVRKTVGSKRLSRDELNQLAREAGVDDPESLPNMDAVTAAIESASAGSQTPWADDGVGHDNEEA